MAMQRCENGHAYDDEKYTSCPYCGISDFDPGTTQAKGDGKTRQKSPDDSPDPDASDEDTDRTQPRQGGGSSGGGGGGQRDEEQRTVGKMFKEKGVDPVVGWLVCTDGPDEGRDYQLRSGRNAIGRSRQMEVCVAGDDTISRENHAALAYDQKANEFTLIPGEGRELVYLNGEALYQPSTLQHHDEIEMGETILRFVPLCDEEFEW
jgi:hypothetical protein